MIYVDGTALCRFLPGVRHSEEWRDWAEARVGEVVTTQLGFTELRQAAELYPRESLDRVLEIVSAVRTTIPALRFSDDNVTLSSHAAAVLKPFAALHLGAAVANETVDSIATYDPALAHVAEIYKLTVVSPGLPDRWYAEYAGPAEDWTPIDLDAPYAPGAEYPVSDAGPAPDAFDEALALARDEEAEAEEAAATEGAAATEVEVAESEATGSEEAATVEVDGTPELAEMDEAEDDASIPVPTAVLEDPAPDESESESEHDAFARALREAEEAALVGLQTAADAPEALEDEADPVVLDLDAVDDSTIAVPVLPDTAEAETTAVPEVPSTEPGATEPAVAAGQDAAAERRAELLARVGSYQPRVQAWGEDESAPSSNPEDVAAEPVMEAEPAAQAEPAAEAPRPARTPYAPKIMAPARPAVVAEPAIAQPEPAIAQPEPAIAPIVPHGAPVRRPMREQAGAPQRRPLPPSPIERESGAAERATTAPIKWNVELDEPESYAPQRYEPNEGRTLPVAGRTEATIPAPAEPYEVPALEPLTRPAPPAPPPAPAQPPAPEPAPAPAPEVKKGRRGKKAEKRGGRKGADSPPAAPAKDPYSPPAEGEGAGWSLDDVIGKGGG